MILSGFAEVKSPKEQNAAKLGSYDMQILFQTEGEY